jgi:hypothetical protein
MCMRAEGSVDELVLGCRLLTLAMYRSLLPKFACEVCVCWLFACESGWLSWPVSFWPEI